MSLACCSHRLGDDPWGVRNFYRDVWQPARAAAGVDFTLYDLRHTFSSRLLAAGIPLVEVAAWMGHSLRAGGTEVDNTTSRVYAHATGEWREIALAELTTLVTGVRARRSSDSQRSVSEPSALACGPMRLDENVAKTWATPSSEALQSHKPPVCHAGGRGFESRRSRCRGAGLRPIRPNAGSSPWPDDGQNDSGTLVRGLLPSLLLLGQRPV